MGEVFKQKSFVAIIYQKDIFTYTRVACANFDTLPKLRTFTCLFSFSLCFCTETKCNHILNFYIFRMVVLVFLACIQHLQTLDLVRNSQTPKCHVMASYPTTLQLIQGRDLLLVGRQRYIHRRYIYLQRSSSWDSR